MTKIKLSAQRACKDATCKDGVPNVYRNGFCIFLSIAYHLELVNIPNGTGSVRIDINMKTVEEPLFYELQV